MTKKSQSKPQSPLAAIIAIGIGTAVGITLSMSGLSVLPLVLASALIIIALMFYGYWQVKRAEKATQNHDLEEADGAAPENADENRKTSDPD